MAKIVCGATGSISGAIWDSASNTPTLHATTNISLTTAGVNGATFTAPNTTNACKGFIVLFTGTSTTPRDYTLSLQQSGVDVVSKTLSISTTTLMGTTSTISWVYFQFATPFTYTTTAAGTYRPRIVASVTAGSVAADAAGSAFAYIAVDDRAAAFGGSDEVFIISPNLGASTNYTVTNVGTNTFGNNLDVTATTPTIRSLGLAGLVGWGSVLKMDTAVSSSLTSKGHLITFHNGELQAGTVASPMPAGVTATLSMSMAAIGTAVLRTYVGGKCIVQGQPRTYYKTTYVSGTGTAASPLVVSTPVDWEVGDEIVVATTDLQASNEYRFIITKNSPTSYVLSNTAGGAENALTSTHAVGGHVLLLTRNVVFSAPSTAIQAYFLNSDVTNDGYVDFDWMRFNNWSLVQVAIALTNAAGDMDYCVIYNTLSGFVVTTTKTVNTYNGIISLSTVGTTSGSQIGYIRATSSANNKTFNDCFALGANANGRGGFTIASYNITLNRCFALGTMSSDRRSLGEGGFGLSSAGSVTINDSGAIGNTFGSVVLSGATDIVFNNFTSSGSAVVSDVYTVTDTYNTALFNNSTFGALALIANYLLAITGTLVRFHNYQNTANNHRWYTVNGQGLSTGTGLSDTTVRTGGSLAVRLAAETSEGVKHTFKIVAKPNTFVSVNGFVRMNAAFSGDASTVLTAELYLPGSTTADATQTITKVADTWAPYNIGALYSGSVTQYATVFIRASNPLATAGAYAYHDDIYNGTNPITAIDVWDEGQPSDIMFEQLGDAAAVWAVSTAGLTTAGTTGKVQADSNLSNLLVKDGLS